MLNDTAKSDNGATFFINQINNKHNKYWPEHDIKQYLIEECEIKSFKQKTESYFKYSLNQLTKLNQYIVEIKREYYKLLNNTIILDNIANIDEYKTKIEKLQGMNGPIDEDYKTLVNEFIITNKRLMISIISLIETEVIKQMRQTVESKAVFSDETLWDTENSSNTNKKNNKTSSKNPILDKTSILGTLNKLFNLAHELNNKEKKMNQSNHLATKSFLLNIDYIAALYNYLSLSGDKQQETALNDVVSKRNKLIGSLESIRLNNVINVDYKTLSQENLKKITNQSITDYINHCQKIYQNLIADTEKLSVPENFEDVEYNKIAKQIKGKIESINKLIESEKKLAAKQEKDKELLLESILLEDQKKKKKLQKSGLSEGGKAKKKTVARQSRCTTRKDDNVCSQKTKTQFLGAEEDNTNLNLAPTIQNEAEDTEESLIIEYYEKNSNVPYNYEWKPAKIRDRSASTDNKRNDTPAPKSNSYIGYIYEQVNYKSKIKSNTGSNSKQNYYNINNEVLKKRTEHKYNLLTKAKDNNGQIAKGCVTIESPYQLPNNLNQQIPVLPQTTNNLVVNDSAVKNQQNTEQTLFIKNAKLTHSNNQNINHLTQSNNQNINLTHPNSLTNLGASQYQQQFNNGNVAPQPLGFLIMNTSIVTNQYPEESNNANTVMPNNSQVIVINSGINDDNRPYESVASLCTSVLGVRAWAKYYADKSPFWAGGIPMSDHMRVQLALHSDYTPVSYTYAGNNQEYLRYALIYEYDHQTSKKQLYEVPIIAYYNIESKDLKIILDYQNKQKAPPFKKKNLNSIIEVEEAEEVEYLGVM